jgi:hypothetical protein
VINIRFQEDGFIVNKIETHIITQVTEANLKETQEYTGSSLYHAT